MRNVYGKNNIYYPIEKYIFQKMVKYICISSNDTLYPISEHVMLIIILALASIVIIGVAVCLVIFRRYQYHVFKYNFLLLWIQLPNRNTNPISHIPGCCIPISNIPGFWTPISNILVLGTTYSRGYIGISFLLDP